MLALLLGCLSATALAFEFRLLEPTERTQWTTGQDVDIFWKVEGHEDKSLANLEFDLMQGRSKTPELIDNIAFGVDASHGDAFWTVDKGLPTGSDYFIRVTCPEEKGFVHDSAFFSVQNPGLKKGGDKDISGRTSSAARSRSAPKGRLTCGLLTIAALACFL